VTRFQDNLSELKSCWGDTISVQKNYHEIALP